MRGGFSRAYNSSAALELRERNSRAQAGLAIEVAAFDGLDISMAVRGIRAERRRRRGRRDLLPRRLSAGRSPGHENGDSFLSWSDSFDWRVDTAFVRVPPGARRAVLQINKTDGFGSIRIDDVRITASPNPEAGSWTPFQVSRRHGRLAERSAFEDNHGRERARRLVSAPGAGRFAGIGDRQERALDVRRQGTGAVLWRFAVAARPHSSRPRPPMRLPIAWPARASTSSGSGISIARTGLIAVCSTTRVTTPRSSIRLPSSGSTIWLPP